MLSSRSPILSVSFWNTLFSFVLTGAIGSIFFQRSPGLCGDYPQNFEVLFQGMGISVVLWLIFHIAYLRIPNAFIAHTFLLTFIRYYLAYILFIYGISKVLVGQFAHTTANMDARLIELAPMRMAWAFFGYSKGYQQFLGWCEVIPSILLLFRRTTLLGAFLSFVVMLNVFLVNIFFDICVKLNSGIYTALSLYLVLQYVKRLWNVFFTNRIVEPLTTYVLEKPRWLIITNRVVNYLALAFMIYLLSDYAWDFYKYSLTHTTPTPVQGAWKSSVVMDWKDGEWKTKNATDTLFADRIFFDGFNGVIRSDFIRDRFRFSVDSAGNQLTANFTNEKNERNFAPLKWKFERTSPDSLKLWIKWKKDSLMMKCFLRKEKLTRY